MIQSVWFISLPFVVLLPCVVNCGYGFTLLLGWSIWRIVCRISCPSLCHIRSGERWCSKLQGIQEKWGLLPALKRWNYLWTLLFSPLTSAWDFLCQIISWASCNTSQNNLNGDISLFKLNLLGKLLMIWLEEIFSLASLFVQILFDMVSHKKSKILLNINHSLRVMCCLKR